MASCDSTPDSFGALSLHLLLALLPLYVRDLSELEISRIRGEQAGRLGIGRRQADLGVDVEHAAGAARRPDGGGGVGGVMLQVIAIHWAIERVRSRRLLQSASYHAGAGRVHARRWTYLVSLAREVVSRLEHSSDTLVNGGITTVIGTEHRVLEASRVLDINVKLAVLALLGDGDTRANGGDVGVEDESDEGLVGGELSAHGALRTSSSSICNPPNGDLGQIVSYSRDW